jgi:SPP1 gp7 family putative phage head morphogenesis protein
MNPEALFNGISGFGSEGHREQARDIALIREIYDFYYIEPDLSDDDIKAISQVIANNLSQGMGMRDMKKDLIEKTGLCSSDSERIARTETTRIKNLANWYRYKKKGFSRFKVDFTKEACSKCVSKYKDTIFLIDDISSLPPVHDLCMCVAIFLQ